MSDFSALPLGQLAWAYADALNRASHHTHQATKATEDAGRIAAELRRRMIPGEVVDLEDGSMLVMEAPKPNGRRSVNREAIHRFIETLGPLGLGPQEKVTTTYAYPTVAELQRRATVLYERHGIALEELVETPPDGEPQLLVRSVERA